MSATLIKEEQAVVEFKSLRIGMEERLHQLQSAQQTEEVRKAIRWLNGAMATLCTGDENDNCGDTMVIPLLPR